MRFYWAGERGGSGNADLGEKGFPAGRGAGEDDALGAQVGEDGEFEGEGTLLDGGALAERDAVGAGGRDVVGRRVGGDVVVHGDV